MKVLIRSEDQVFLPTLKPTFISHMIARLFVGPLPGLLLSTFTVFTLHTHVKTVPRHVVNDLARGKTHISGDHPRETATQTDFTINFFLCQTERKKCAIFMMVSDIGACPPLREKL